MKTRPHLFWTLNIIPFLCVPLQGAAKTTGSPEYTILDATVLDQQLKDFQNGKNHRRAVCIRQSSIQYHPAYGPVSIPSDEKQPSSFTSQNK